MAGGTELHWIVIPTGQRASGEWIDDTLKLRLAEAGLAAKAPLAGNFPRQRVEPLRDPDPWEAVNRLFHDRGWTDGLPIVPPTLGRVEEFVRAGGRAPDEVLGELEPLRGVATVEKLAANAAMAGCLPGHFPIVLAAVEALLDPAFNLRGVQTTDENVAPLLIVGGPAAARLGVHGGMGALGPGWRANACIGRAVRLILNNLGGGWPGAVSLAGLGQPGRYTLCLAEEEALSPWPPLRADLGFPQASTVTVFRAETCINVTGGLEEIASAMRSAASLFTMAYSGKVAVLLSPWVARQLADAGASKADVAARLHGMARMPVAEWRASWLYRTLRNPHEWPEWVRRAEPSGTIPVTERPEDLSVIVAGGNLPIPQHAYFPSWGFPPCRITREIRLPPPGAGT